MLNTASNILAYTRRQAKYKSSRIRGGYKKHFTLPITLCVVEKM